MPTGIPLPDNDRSGLFEGLMSGNKIRQGNEQLRQHAELLPFQKMLAQARANEAQQWANLLGYGGGTMPQEGQMPQMGNQMMQPGMMKGNGVQMPNQRGGQMNIDMPYQKPQQQQMTSQHRNGEREIKPGNPALYGADRFAGFGPIPPVQQKIDANGNQITRYPSGRETIMPVEDLEAKGERETRIKGKQHEQELNQKRAQELREIIPQSEYMRDKAQQLVDLLNDPDVKKHAPDWFGTSVFGTENAMKWRKTGVHNKKFGQLEALYADLVGGFAQEISPGRTLASALGIAQNAKPSFLDEYEQAQGKAEQLLKGFNHGVQNVKKQYKEATSGQKPDFKTENYALKEEGPESNVQKKVAQEKEKSTSQPGGSSALVTIKVGNRIAHVPIERVDGFMMKNPTGEIINEPR